MEEIKDVILNDVAIRAAGKPFSEKIYLIQDNKEIKHKFRPISGYLIEETEPGESFIDKLTFIPE